VENTLFNWLQASFAQRSGTREASGLRMNVLRHGAGSS
jgi:hypothetical protein